MIDVVGVVLVGIAVVAFIALAWIVAGLDEAEQDWSTTVA